MNPAYLVEGHLEQKFIQTVCPGHRVQRINCNGESVNLSQIAKRVGSLGRLLKSKHDLLIIIFDREQRSETSEEIEREFIKHLKDENLETNVIVAVPDRHIENWILADFETFKAISNTSKSPEEFEGCSGKSKIKSFLPPGKPYIETINGVAWLKACRPVEIAKNSVSFSRLLTAPSALDCWWFKKEVQSQIPALLENPTDSQAGSKGN